VDSLWVPVGGLALANLCFLVLLIAITRELGVILVRLGPASVRPGNDGLPIGQSIEALEIETLSGAEVQISPTKFQSKLLVFLAPRCDVCAQMVPALKSLASAYAGEVSVIAISSGAKTAEDYALAQRLAPVVPYACSVELTHRFKIHATPYVVLLDTQNVVRAQGIANNLQHLESLFALEVRQLAGQPLPGLADHTTHAVGRLS